MPSTQPQTFYVIVTCDCGSQYFHRSINEHMATAVLRCAECNTEYRQPAVRHIPLRVAR
jgi:RNase P subunit RPR2